ncbi:hypothetical protein RJ641_000334 [Dillenia turbinata]|uniref:Retrotransposon Copia-like N-terminal domain-containing protein n=1 Tax=Dillenia turbinata TaxID=194707 RepID=A0AAN8ZQY8_9MAGN
MSQTDEKCRCEPVNMAVVEMKKQMMTEEMQEMMQKGKNCQARAGSSLINLPNLETSDLSGEQQLNPNLIELTTKMAEILNKQTPTTETSAAQIGIKLDGTNYALWSQVVKMYISGKDKLRDINGDLPLTSQTDPTFRKWRTDNAIVKCGLINSMDVSLISNFIRFPTAKMVWDSIATTYFDGSDTSQVYDLRRRVTRLRQSGEERVYIFLDGLDDRLDKIRADVLQTQPFPTVEQAYAQVRREAIRQMVMITGNNNETPGAILTSKSIKSGQSISSSTGSLSLSNGKSEPQLSLTPFVESSQGDVLLSNSGNNFSYQAIDICAWILDSGATDHMTYDAIDFPTTSPPRRTTIANANGWFILSIETWPWHRLEGFTGFTSSSHMEASLKTRRREAKAARVASLAIVVFSV